MKYRIHCGEDSIDISAETIEEIQSIVEKESKKRDWDWKKDDIWSEEMK